MASTAGVRQNQSATLSRYCNAAKILRRWPTDLTPASLSASSRASLPSPRARAMSTPISMPSSSNLSTYCGRLSRVSISATSAGAPSGGGALRASTLATVGGAACDCLIIASTSALKRSFSARSRAVSPSNPPAGESALAAAAASAAIRASSDFCASIRALTLASCSLFAPAYAVAASGSAVPGSSSYSMRGDCAANAAPSSCGAAVAKARGGGGWATRGGGGSGAFFCISFSSSAAAGRSLSTTCAVSRRPHRAQ
mmetsp:Transcript_42428/g.117413  ORF Transcript_42428/g.117413 Transcript_42428/m.117413 type:complete len:256 (-) Transcript_42428:253-1020(-)